MKRHAGLISIGVLAFAACTTCGCVADPTTPQPTSTGSSEDSNAPLPGEPLPAEEIEEFGAVAALNAGSACSGTLIDTGVPQGPAYVLTDGRCVGGLGRPPQSTAVGLEWSGTAEFLRAAETPDRAIPLEVVELTYATMRHAAIGIVRLNATLADAEALGIGVLPIADEQPRSGDEVASIGVPVIGLEPDAQVLRRADCTLGSQHSLIESFWLFLDAFSTDCDGVLAGSSGSPLVHLDEDGRPVEVVAMITASTSGASRSDAGACAVNRPCELTEAGAVPVGRTDYAQSVAGIGRCFDPSTGLFTLGEACPLRMSDVWAERGGGVFRPGQLPDSAGRLPEASFVGESVGVLSTALVPIGDGTVCADKETYADADTHLLPRAGQPWEAVGVIVAPELPGAEGHYLLCAVSGERYDSAASVIFEVDRTPPTVAAGAEVERLDGGGVAVRPLLSPPELAAVRYTWAAPDTVDCDDLDAFQEFSVAPLIIAAADLPAVYCIYGLDAAGNRTPVTSIDIPRTR